MEQTGGRVVEIGRIEQAHGLDGDVRIHLDDDREGSIREGELLYLRNRRGDWVPSRIEKVRIEEKKKRRLFFVKFDRIADRTEAESFRDTPLFRKGESEEPVSPRTDPNDLTGFVVEDETGRVGTVTEMIRNRAQTLIVVGGTGRPDHTPLLIPNVDAFVVRIDREKRRVICREIGPLKTL